MHTDVLTVVDDVNLCISVKPFVRMQSLYVRASPMQNTYYRHGSNIDKNSQSGQAYQDREASL